MCDQSKIPPAWEKNDLTDFLDGTKKQQLITYHNARGPFAIVFEVDAIFKKLCDNLNQISKYETGLFINRAFSAYRAGIGLSMGGQVVESFAVFRSCLENALYGLYVNQNEGSFTTWLERHKDAASLKKVKAEFSYGKLIKFLENWSKPIYEVADVLYVRTIDFGGHPNERAITSNLTVEVNPGEVRIDTKYITDDPLILMHGLRTGAEIGICALDIFQSVYKERFAIMGLRDRLCSIKKQLADPANWQIVS